jgi:methionyl-tRNA formyltransferase
MNGDKTTLALLHRMTKDLDLGDVICEIEFPVSETDDEQTLLDRTEDSIPELLAGFANYLRGRQDVLYTVTEGTYLRIMDYEDYRIRPESDSVEIISRKIRARSAHSGAFIRHGGMRVYVKDMESEAKKEGDSPGIFLSGGVLRLVRDGENLRFRVVKTVPE